MRDHHGVSLSIRGASVIGIPGDSTEVLDDFETGKAQRFHVTFDIARADVPAGTWERDVITRAKDGKQFRIVRVEADAVAAFTRLHCIEVPT